MGGQLAGRVDATGRRAGGRWCRVLLALTLLPAVATPAAAQQDATAARDATAVQDTAAARDAGGTRDARTGQDTVGVGSAAADSLAADTTLTPRQRALLRLRALPRSPVQPDTTLPDSLLADSLAADSLAAGAADSLQADAPGPGGPVGDTVPAGGVPAGDTARVGPERRAPADTSRLRPRPPDAVRPRPGGPIRTRRADSVGVRSERAPVGEAEIREQLGALQGYVATEYTGQGAVFWADSNQLHLSGDSRIAREGSELATDSLLVYDGESGVVCGYGNPVLSGETEPVESRRVCFDIERDLGMAEAARTKFTEQGTWYVGGADNRVFILPREDGNTLYGRRAEFTSCDLEHPHYAFQARSLKMVEDRMMVARDVTLEFDDVPVFWLPWMVQSIRPGRRSGLLMPQFGVNDIVRNNAGYTRRISNVGFYWAINDYVSTRGTFEWWADSWTAVEGALSYYWRRQFLRGGLTAKHYWRQRESGPAGRELTLNTSNSWQPDERTRVRLDARYASSTDFVRQNSFDPQELNRSIRSSASVNRTFDWGSMTLGADRQQQLSTEQVDWTLPSLQLSLSPITLLSTEDGLDITWRGSGNATRRVRDVEETLQPNLRDTESLNSSLNHSLSVGRFSLGQRVNYQKQSLGPRRSQGSDPAIGSLEDLLDVTLVSPPGAPDLAVTSEDVGWSTSLGFQQNLWIGTTLSPSVSVSGTQVRNDTTRFWLQELDAGDPSGFVAQPVRLSAGATLTTAIYGFWPGFARYSRIRHKIAPTLRWSYSPQPTATPLQDSVFGVRTLRERNELTLSFNQTFEAKVEQDDTAAADTVVTGQPGEPRRLPQVEKITLLALNTSTPLRYDFVAAEEDGRGFLTTSITNSIRSDLVQGLQLSMTHDLFEEGEAPENAAGVAPRTFSPFLTRLSASFSIDNDFWLFRFLGLSAGAGAQQSQEAQDTVADVDAQMREVGAEGPQTADLGGVVPGGGRGAGMGAGGPGRWRASLTYSLDRTRPTAELADPGSQLLRANVSFDPTQNWSVQWTTSYSFTSGEFADHRLTLSRDLHRWQANFNFLKAQNGNFAFQFHVSLRDNPDLKVDYDQRTRGGGAPGGGPAPVGFQ